jgi:hypothetical protein
MSQVDRTLVEAAPSDDVGSDRCRSLYPLWPPRPATIGATLFVALSLFWIIFIDWEVAGSLSALYGWPFHYRFSAHGPTPSSGTFYAAALAADLVVMVALLASTYVTTQIGACLLVRSPRLTLRAIGASVIALALILAGCRREAFLWDLFRTGFYYSLASFSVMLACVLFRLELPKVDDREQPE